MSDWKQDMEKWGADVIFGREKGFLAGFARLVLFFFSLLFSLLVRLRITFYRWNWKEQSQLGTQVISIGNLTVGGTGKTPVVEMFARELQKRGRKVAILSRGYKSRKLKKPQIWKGEILGKPGEVPKLASDGKDLLLDALHAGDEPYMLARNLPGVSVIVDRNRVAAGRFAIERLDCNTLLLDDGMQYLPLDRGVEVTLMDHNSPFGTKTLLPRGTLREPRSHLSRADLIFITKCKKRADPKLRLQARKLNPQAPIVEMAHVPTHLENVFDSADRRPLEDLKGKHVAAISGIAVPESFEIFLKEMGANILFHRIFGDHQIFPQEDVENFMERCLLRDADWVLTTEKDAVRFPRPKELEIPIYFLRIEVKILHGKKEWQEALDRLSEFPDLGPTPWLAKKLLT